ncbi:MAG: pyridoxal phosphate-dependent aminotransferase [Acidobacteriota bacterium]
MKRTALDNDLNATGSNSRRSFLRFAALAAAAPMLSEAHFAMAAQQATTPQPKRGRASHPQMKPPADAVLINANENPMGPCKEAQDAICAMAPLGGRYDLLDEGAKLTKTIAAKLNVSEDHIAVYAGSSEPLQYAVMAFTSPERSVVTADPSYEAPMWAAASTGTKVRKVALTADCAHDVKAMVAADANAGLIYICNPNNPTGTLTAKKDIEWALENKPKGSVLLVDEAYIHLSDAPDVLDMVRADKDLIVLRTFSKVYGMAGIRCGMALARPDLLAKLYAYGQNALPVTAVAAATASLMQANLVPQRKKIIEDIRNETLAWLKTNGYKVIGDPVSNCFMIDTGRPGPGVIQALMEKKVYIGRVWPVWPNAVRVTVGSAEDMKAFRAAFDAVMKAPPVENAELDRRMLEAIDPMVWRPYA